MVLKRVDALSVGKIGGLLYAVLGLVAGLIFTAFSLLGAAIGTLEGEGGTAVLGLIFGVGAVVILPVFYGAIGFVGGLVTGLLYNVAARFVGGIELELE